MGVEGLDRLRVVKRSVDTAAAWGPDHQGAAERSVGAVSHPCCLRNDLVEGWVDEIGELDLCHGQQSSKRHPYRDADDRRLGQGRIDDASFTEFLHPADADAEYSAAVADVFSEQDHTVVGDHLVVQGVADRVDNGLFAHVISPALEEDVTQGRGRLGIRRIPRGGESLIDLALHLSSKFFRCSLCQHVVGS